VYVTGSPEFVTAARVISLPSHSRHSGIVGKVTVWTAAVVLNDFVTVAEPYGAPPEVPLGAETVIVQTPTSSKFTRPLDDTVHTDNVPDEYVSAAPLSDVATRL